MIAIFITTAVKTSNAFRKPPAGGYIIYMGDRNVER
jgi:hypothetical protein